MIDESRGASDVVIEDATISFSAADGIYVENASLLLRGSVVGNAIGVRNGTPSKGVVDARRVWWGHASGSLHRRKNPNGMGNEVSDGVEFFPWSVDENGTVPSQVRVEGPSRVGPGETVDYAVSYYAAEPIQDAVLVLVLPTSATYVDSTEGGGQKIISRDTRPDPFR